ncbi:gamma-glutamylcyclotransferase [Lentibacter algarum]|nr:gamma-glutamylcyclotransferase [Lentibacter algarum]MBU2980887.1 gamma-glutamylcyclotransferase [Lentibacter algarum]
MDHAYFFGYGSLVNRATHSFSDTHHATAKGWRRAWRQTSQRRACYLTAVPDITCEISGLIAHVPNDDWAALDIRERGYARLPANSAISHPLQTPASLAIYAIAPENQSDPTRETPILLSYLDVVIQGYLQEFGEDGAAQFFATTSGWDAPVLNDRASPVYPRHQVLTPAETAFVDGQLAALNVGFIGGS